MNNKYTAETITQQIASDIARAALAGDSRYNHEAIGAEDDDINGMQVDTGGRLVVRANNDSEVAVYERKNGSLAIVANANGPVEITIATI